VSQENVEIVRRGYEHFQATGDLLEETVAPDFVWDMSKLGGVVDQQVYEGIEATRSFIQDWNGAWDHWEIEVDRFHDAGDRVVAVVRQRGQSKTTGMPVEMLFAQVWTVHDGMETRMEMYADPAEALEAVGLEE
jgi:ketosteroid isomerase-like protein